MISNMLCYLTVVILLSTVYSQQQNDYVACLINNCDFTVDMSLNVSCKQEVENTCQGFLGDSFSLCDSYLCLRVCRLSLTGDERSCEKQCRKQVSQEVQSSCPSSVYQGGKGGKGNGAGQQNGNSNPDNYKNSDYNQSNERNQYTEKNSDDSDDHAWVVPVVVSSCGFVVLIIILCVIRKVLLRRKQQRVNLQNMQPNAAAIQAAPQNQQNQSQDNNFIIPEGVIHENDEKLFNNVCQQNITQGVNSNKVNYPNLQQVQIKSKDDTPSGDLAESCPIQNAYIDNQQFVQLEVNPLN